LAVASLVIEHGGTEDQACTAILHDSLEDTSLTYWELRLRMGKAVADMVRECSDTEEEAPREVKKQTFVRRKSDYLATLAKKADHPAVLVALADKVNNAENSVRDLRVMRSGTDPAAESRFWATFNSESVDQQRWWYESLASTFEELPLDDRALPLAARLRAAVDEMFPPAPTERTM
jgi:HD domain